VLKTLVGHKFDVYGAIWYKNDTRIISSGRDKTIKMWDAETGELIKSIDCHKNTIM
jgi:WD40 repeat protein